MGAAIFQGLNDVQTLRIIFLFGAFCLLTGLMAGRQFLTPPAPSDPAPAYPYHMSNTPQDSVFQRPFFGEVVSSHSPPRSGDGPQSPYHLWEHARELENNMWLRLLAPEAVGAIYQAERKVLHGAMWTGGYVAVHYFGVGVPWVGLTYTAVMALHGPLSEGPSTPGAWLPDMSFLPLPGSHGPGNALPASPFSSLSQKTGVTVGSAATPATGHRLSITNVPWNEAMGFAGFPGLS